MHPEKRIGSDLSVQQALLFGLILNIIPDYLSLFETRWLLQRFRHIDSFFGQLTVLLIDTLITGTIIWLAISAYQRFIGQPAPSAVEMAALFSVFSVFFYSTFLTSLWAWLYCVSTWFMRLFARTRLKDFLDTESRPETQVALVGAVLLFGVALLLSPLLKQDPDAELSVFDDALCAVFPKTTCDDVARLTKNEQRALHYLARHCEAGAIEHGCSSFPPTANDSCRKGKGEVVQIA